MTMPLEFDSFTADISPLARAASSLNSPDCAVERLVFTIDVLCGGQWFGACEFRDQRGLCALVHDAAKFASAVFKFRDGAGHTRIKMTHEYKPYNFRPRAQRCAPSN